VCGLQSGSLALDASAKWSSFPGSVSDFSIKYVWNWKLLPACMPVAVHVLCYGTKREGDGEKMSTGGSDLPDMTESCIYPELSSTSITCVETIASGGDNIMQ